MRPLKLMLMSAGVSLVLAYGLFQLSEMGREPVTDHARFHTIAQGQFGPIGDDALLTERKNYVLRTTNDFERFWNELHIGAEVVPPRPQVIFAREEVIAVFQGVQGTTGHHIEVKDIIDTEDERVVFIELTVPGPLCNVGQVVTNPYHLVVVPKGNTDLNAIESFAKTPCEVN